MSRESNSSEITEETRVKEKNDLTTLKNYVLSCPSVDSKSKAMNVVLTAIEKEMSRIERDEKLRKKFSNSTSLKDKSKNNYDMEEEDIIKISKSQIINKDDEVFEEDMEWQDVNSSQVVSASESEVATAEATIGKILAEKSISSMSNAGVLVKTAFEAIAVALHSSLKNLDFICTGIPEEKKSAFAPAVRDLPSHIFLPSGWNKHDSTISIRYRKPDVGMCILTCRKESAELSEEDSVSVVFYNTSCQPENSSNKMTFLVSLHVNFHSFQRAMRSSALVQPALHYKALPALLNEFCRTFDLGDTLKVHSKSPPKLHDGMPPSYSNFTSCNDSKPTLASSCRQNDFQSDLSPPGLHFPSSSSQIPPLVQPASGNLMGPNHPSFTAYRDEYHDYDNPLRGPPTFSAPFTGGVGMQPRFDPYGPPMGPTFPNSGGIRGGRGPRRGRGRFVPGADPNPDHMRPPNDFDPSDLYL